MNPDMLLGDGSRIAIIGGGPAGSFTAIFLADMAQRADYDIAIDIFEPKDFNQSGPKGCNHCGGIVSESLVQMLAIEGIILPDSVIQRGIEAYELHSFPTRVRIETPLEEKRIAAIYRGKSPAKAATFQLESFDDYLLRLARERGVSIISERVLKLRRGHDGRPILTAKQGELPPYDLLVGAVGVNANSLELFENVGMQYAAPRLTRTIIAEMHLGEELLNDILGDAMHVFLQDIPGVEFAALVPKGEFVTACLVGDDLDKATLDAFLDSPEIRALFSVKGEPFDLPARVCGCKPYLNLGERCRPYADRVALVGDCGVTRLFKDGIGAAYRTAKVLAATALFQGVSKADFHRHYRPMCRTLARDNAVGRLMFAGVGMMRRRAFLRQAVLRMVSQENAMPPRRRLMSSVMWDTFTGSAPYTDIFARCLNPRFAARLMRCAVSCLAAPANAQTSTE